MIQDGNRVVGDVLDLLLGLVSVTLSNIVAPVGLISTTKTCGSGWRVQRVVRLLLK